MKKRFSIRIDGCDDSTEIEVVATEDQAKELRLLSALSRRNSQYGCQPKLSVAAIHETVVVAES